MAVVQHSLLPSNAWWFNIPRERRQLLVKMWVAYYKSAPALSDTKFQDFVIRQQEQQAINDLLA